MKNAVVFTHFALPNYGANLQAYATSLILKNCGYKPKYVQFLPDALQAMYRDKVAEDQYRLHLDFVDLNLDWTCIKTFDYRFDTRFDLACTGSDAVFRLNSKISQRPDLQYPNPYWLTNMDCNKISISASSMGTNFSKNLMGRHVENFKKNLESFKYLSVRDEWTQKELLKYGVVAERQLDPVMFLPELDPNYDFRTSAKLKRIVCSLPNYFDKKWKDEFSIILQKSGYEFLDIGTPEHPSSIKLTPSKWYKEIATSSMYVGTRFHPLVVAITNNVPCIAIDQYARHFFERKSSKSFLLLKEHGPQNLYLDKLTSRYLTPEKLMKLIIRRLDVKKVDNINTMLKLRNLFEIINGFQK